MERKKERKRKEENKKENRKKKTYIYLQNPSDWTIVTYPRHSLYLDFVELSLYRCGFCNVLFVFIAYLEPTEGGTAGCTEDERGVETGGSTSVVMGKRVEENIGNQGQEVLASRKAVRVQFSSKQFREGVCGMQGFLRTGLGGWMLEGDQSSRWTNFFVEWAV